MKSTGSHRSGVATLALSVVLCGAAHLLLRHGAVELSPDLLSMGRVAIGLGVYGCGTLLWLYCLQNLDLSFAFPASAVQFVLVFAGAHWILGEHISAQQLAGGAIILAGITILFLERGKSHA